MKNLVIFATLLFSLNAMADSVCYNRAKMAAFSFVKKDTNGEIATMSDFEDIYSSDMVDVYYMKEWQKEFWSFYNTSAIVNVEVDFKANKCVVKKVELVQNDQDED